MLAHQVEITIPKTEITVEEYLQLITLAKINVTDNKDYTIDLLKGLIKENPDFPDAYFALAEIYENSDPQQAIDYYSQLISFCPEHFHAIEKRAKLYRATNQKAACLDDIETAMKLKKKESVAREQYHRLLRASLTHIGDLSMLPLITPNTPTGFDDKDIKLTNGAAEDAYLVSACTSILNHKLALYYAEKAVLKFEHDVISLSIGAYLHHRLGRTELALQKISACIEKYRFPAAYFYRAEIYRSSRQYSLAKPDFKEFVLTTDKLTVEVLAQINLPAYVDILNDIDPRQTAEEKAAVAGLEKVIDIDNEIAKINRLRERENIDNETLEKIIKRISQLLCLYPYATFYFDRAYFNCRKSEFAAAKFDYSMAILLSDETKLSQTYTLRSCINMTLGDLKSAHEDIENALQSMPENADNHSKKRKAEILTDFSKFCLDQGRLQLINKDFRMALNIFELGISKKPTCELLIQSAEALAHLENYKMAYAKLQYADYINSISKGDPGDMKKMENKLHSLMQDYDRKQKNNQRREIKSINHINDLFSKARTVPPPDPKPESSLVSAEPDEKKKRKKTPTARGPKPQLSFRKNHRNNLQIISSVLNATPTAEKAGDNEQEEEKETPKIPALKKQYAEEKAASQKQLLKNEKIRKEKKKIKNKQKKAEKQKKIQKKPDTATEEESSAENAQLTEVTAPRVSDSPSTLFGKFNPHNIQGILTPTVPLLEIEKTIFTKLEAYKQYGLRIVGSSAAYRTQAALKNQPFDLTKIDDIDIVTTIPLAIIQELFPQARSNPHMPNVMTLVIDDVKIDFCHSDDLQNDPLQRDFFTVWLNGKGHATDPSAGREFECLRNNILPCARKNISQLLKEDPIRILRAIYTANKGDFVIPEKLKDQIFIDRELLVPGDNLAPERINHWLRKIFSQGKPEKNYESLRKFGLLKILFPEVYNSMENTHEWILAQIQRCKNYESQSLEFFYASAIVAFLAPELDMTRATATLLAGCRIRRNTLLNQSKLFSAQLSRESALDSIFEQCIRSWQIYHASKNTTTESLDPPPLLKR